MILEFKTSVFKELLGKAMKAVTASRLLPITGLVGITVQGNYLLLETYDGYNKLTIFGTLPKEYPDAYAVVDAQQLNALISKLTADNLKLEFNQAYLGVKAGNGSYKFDIALEDGTNPVKFPFYQEIEAADNLDAHGAKLSELMLLQTMNESAVAKTTEVISITGAYIGPEVGMITTNAFVACVLNIVPFEDLGRNILLNYSTIKLFSALKDEDISYAIVGDLIVVSDSGASIIGKLMPEVVDYPVERIMKFFQNDFQSAMNLDKNALVKALERLNIFVDTIDKNVIKVHVTEKVVTLTSLSSNAVEVIELANPENILEDEFLVDFSSLESQVKATQDNTITIYYGSESAIVIVDALSSHVVALSVEE